MTIRRNAAPLSIAHCELSTVYPLLSICQEFVMVILGRIRDTGQATRDTESLGLRLIEWGRRRYNTETPPERLRTTPASRDETGAWNTIRCGSKTYWCR